ncbi:MAG TPA: Glu/Leu/Phe/Val dehydrogenase dimerization domain-containing protein [Actinomycetota bacterium]|nr:Glu/Leu/Phe/Val dehydrogenase dimerization domain-containing protein [Actinomycetota bacterium]
MFEELIRAWDGEEVVIRYDPPTSTWMFVGVHSTVLGPGMGGTRMKVYAVPADGLRDVLRLSGAMTLKNAAAGLPYGGGKAVLAVPGVPLGDERRRLILRYADLVASIGGSYVTACDMNTTEVDMDLIGERCPHVLGRSRDAGGSGSSGPATAVGVFHGIRASVAHAFGSNDLSGRTVVVQGTGAVGARLAEMLAEAGASVVVSDVENERALEVADRVGAEIAAPDVAPETPCDVLSPCAVGATMNGETIPRLRCRIVAGAANNQLATPKDADRLRYAGILYAPDFVINAGGVLSLAGRETLGWSEERLQESLRAIGDTLAEVFREADTVGVSTDEAAQRLARARIDAAS